MPAESRYELAVTGPRSAPPRVVVEQGSIVPRAVLAAALSPVLSYWVPSRAVPWLAERGTPADVVWLSLILAGLTLLGAYAATLVAMRVRRISEQAPPVSQIEEVLVALLGLVVPTVPLWLGLSPGDAVAQSVLIQAGTVFMAVLLLGGVLGDARWVPPLMVGSVQPPRDLAVRALVAALLPVTMLLALLPAVVASALLDESAGDVGQRILLLWMGVTVVGIGVGLRAWRDGEAPVLALPRQAALTAGAVGIAWLAWNLAGGIDAPLASYLIQPVAILVGTVLLAREREAPATAPVAAPVPMSPARSEPLLVPPAGAILVGRTETPYRNAETGFSETRIEARWMFARPFSLVTAVYRDRHGLTVRKETPTELVLARPGHSPAAVRITAQPTPVVAPDLPPAAPRTEVRVRVSIPDGANECPTSAIKVARTAATGPGGIMNGIRMPRGIISTR